MQYPELGPDFHQAELIETIDAAAEALLLSPGRRAYFIGIAGISMLGLAEIAARRGLIVAGSDPAAHCDDPRWQALGIEVKTRQESQNIDDFAPDFVVYTAAIPAQNPELQRARELGLPCLVRAAFLGLINRQYQRVFNIAGTNGKTTTTALTAKLLIAAGFDPTVHLGAEFSDFGGTVRLGAQNEIMVSEACEFSGSFLAFRSTDAVILNIAHDHVDIFPELKDVYHIFLRFALNLEPGGSLYLPTFAPEIYPFCQELLRLEPDYFSTHQLCLYGYARDCAPQPAESQRIRELLAPYAKSELQVEALQWQGAFASGILCNETERAPFQIAIPGQFNLENALAATALALGAGASLELVAAALPSFTGAEGRFTYCGDYRGARIIADYAHHADSLKLTIETALKMPHRRLHVYFQPITYSRAKANRQGFFEALAMVDFGNMIEVYDNREADHDFSTESIVRELRAAGREASYFPNLEEAEAHARQVIEAGDLALFIGASIREVADRLAGRKSHQEHGKLKAD